MNYYKSIKNQLNKLNNMCIFESSKEISSKSIKKILEYGIVKEIFKSEDKKSRNSIYYLPNLLNENSEMQTYITNIIAKELHLLIGTLSSESKILVVGLGNQFVIADNFGSEIIKKLEPTRHLKLEKKFGNLPSISTFMPSVLGVTGIETADAINAICKIVEPDTIIVFDALCATDKSRFCNTIQFSSDGITPGAGINNARKSIKKNTIRSKKVIAVGVPFLYEINSEKTNFFVTSINIQKLIEIYSAIIAKAIENLIFS